MKTVFKTVLCLYLAVLLWLVLFKFSYDIAGVLFGYQSRSLNLNPFLGFAQNTREVVDNVVVFAPFGLLLSVNFKQVSFWRKLAIIFISSLELEIIQFVLAIGSTDVTDLIANTFGGLVGLVSYHLASKMIDERKIDWFIAVSTTMLMALFLYFRIFVLKVQY